MYSRQPLNMSNYSNYLFYAGIDVVVGPLSLVSTQRTHQLIGLEEKTVTVNVD